jgi:hypothetical protein
MAKQSFSRLRILGNDFPASQKPNLFAAMETDCDVTVHFPLKRALTYHDRFDVKADVVIGAPS